MKVIKEVLFLALLTPLLSGEALCAAEFEVLDRFSVDGYSEFRGSAAVSSGLFTVGASTLVIKNGNIGIGTVAPNGPLSVYAAAGKTHIRIEDENNNGSSGSLYYPLASYYARRDNNIRTGDPLATYGASASIVFTDRPGTSNYALAVRTSDIQFWTASTDGGTGLDANPQMRMAVTAEGNVGIGMVNPGQKLEVGGTVALDTVDFAAGSAGSQLRFFTGAATGNTYGGITVYNSGATGYGNLALVPYGGKVGIGTADPKGSLDVRGGRTVLNGAGNTPVTSLDVYSADSSPASDMMLRYTTARAAGNQHGIEFRDSANEFNGGIFFRQTGSNNGAGLSLFTAQGLGGNGLGSPSALEALTILSGGNVGIGTTAPVGRLSVKSAAGVGNVVVANLNNPYQYGAGSGTAAAVLRFNHTPNDAGSTGVMADIAGGNEDETTSAAGYLAFGTRSGSPEATTERMRLTSNGNVGIGTLNPGAKLELSSAATVPLAILRNTLYSSLNSTGTVALQFAFANHTGPVIEASKQTNNITNLNLYGEHGYNNPQLIMTLSPASEGGKVGIGTTSPNALLALSASSGNSVDLSLNRGYTQQAPPSTYASADEARFKFYQGDAGYGFRRYLDIIANGQAGTANSSIRFFTNSGGAAVGERVRIDEAGNVGIGTTGPGVKLDVNGSIKADKIYIQTSGLVSGPYFFRAYGTCNGSGNNSCDALCSGAVQGGQAVKAWNRAAMGMVSNDSLGDCRGCLCTAWGE